MRQTLRRRRRPGGPTSSTANGSLISLSPMRWPQPIHEHAHCKSAKCGISSTRTAKLFGRGGPCNRSWRRRSGQFTEDDANCRTRRRRVLRDGHRATERRHRVRHQPSKFLSWSVCLHRILRVPALKRQHRLDIHRLAETRRGIGLGPNHY